VCVAMHFILLHLINSVSLMMTENDEFECREAVLMHGRAPSQSLINNLQTPFCQKKNDFGWLTWIVSVCRVEESCCVCVCVCVCAY
jgi:hypothetical protein